MSCHCERHCCCHRRSRRRRRRPTGISISPILIVAILSLLAVRSMGNSNQNTNIININGDDEEDVYDY